MKMKINKRLGKYIAPAIGLLFLGVIAVLMAIVSQEQVPDKSTIAYIPLDNRPVNVYRARCLAEGAGFQLLMPQEQLYRTALDGQVLNNNGTAYGDGEALLDWLDSCEADYYVVSMDQIMSGGLVNSRVADGNAGVEERIARLLEILDGKEAVIFDTVMRLTPTVGYNGCTLEQYSQLREYGKIERPEALSETIEEIVAGYPLMSDGNPIETHIAQDVLEQYLSARQRKMYITEQLLNQLEGNSNIYLYYGVDDSGARNTIQTNEIAYIKSHLYQGSLFAGTDELGLMSITKTICRHYEKTIESVPKVQVTYFGDKDLPADEYDIGTLADNVNAHITSLGVEVNHEQPDLEILVLCKDESTATQEQQERLIDTYLNNKEQNLPTIIIDVTKSEELGEEFHTNEAISMGYLLSYSSWNTAGNSVGIAISNGISRYMYLQYDTHPSKQADTAFLQGLAYSFAKDITYQSAKAGLGEYLETKGLDANNFYYEGMKLQQLEDELMDLLSFEQFTNAFQRGTYIRSLRPLRLEAVPETEVTGIHFPWYRIFEADIDIQIK